MSPCTLVSRGREIEKGKGVWEEMGEGSRRVKR